MNTDIVVSKATNFYDFLSTASGDIVDALPVIGLIVSTWKNADVIDTVIDKFGNQVAASGPIDNSVINNIDSHDTVANTTTSTSTTNSHNQANQENDTSTETNTTTTTTTTTQDSYNDTDNSQQPNTENICTVAPCF